MDNFFKVSAMVIIFVGGTVLVYFTFSLILQVLKELLNTKHKNKSSNGFHEPPRSFMSYSAEELANKKLQVNLIYNAKIYLFIFVVTVLLMLLPEIF
jgi:hypothetical protein